MARPAARPGAASSQLAMLEIGADLEPLPFEDLETNADTDSVRDQLDGCDHVRNCLPYTPQHTAWVE